MPRNEPIYYAYLTPVPIDRIPIEPFNVTPPEPPKSLDDRMSDPVAESWVRIWGEAVTITRACEMLGVSRWTVRKWMDEQLIQSTPDGRVVVRSAAAYINSGATPRQRIPASRQRPERPADAVPKFIP